MTIDIEVEAVISLSEAARYLPPLRGGRRVHLTTLHRWARRGLRGRKLESIRLGGAVCTSREALHRFFNGLSTPQPPMATTRAAQEVEERLKSLGL